MLAKLDYVDKCDSFEIVLLFTALLVLQLAEKLSERMWIQYLHMTNDAKSIKM